MFQTTENFREKKSTVYSWDTTGKNAADKSMSRTVSKDQRLTARKKWNKSTKHLCPYPTGKFIFKIIIKYIMSLNEMNMFGVWLDSEPGLIILYLNSLDIITFSC